VLNKLRAHVARMLMPKAARRAYHAGRNSRLTAGWVTANSSADAELLLSLGKMRERSRQLVRDAGYAKRAKVIVQNNVVGSGIGLQASVTNQRERLLDDVNADIEEAWCEWSTAENCHTGGKLAFADMERQILGQIFEAGEVFIRKHPLKLGTSEVPLALELIEAERLADEWAVPAPSSGNVTMGVERDNFGRPVAYWFRMRHPGDVRTNLQAGERLERVPAEQVMHLYVVNRWPQTRGEPWLHTAMGRLNDMDGYAEAEIVGARAAANYVGFIESPDAPTPDVTEEGTGQRQFALEPGMVEYLAPGEKMSFAAPNRPNAAMDPFMRMMLREVAAGVGCSYESLSRDYSQSNYSSSRLALLDDRDLWREMQTWFIRNFREPLHREWLRLAVYARAVTTVPLEDYALNASKYEAVTFKPRGWGWVDPTKEVAAYKEAVLAGFTTNADVIAATGGGKDFEDWLRDRKRELDRMKEAGIEVDTTFKVPPPPVVAHPPAAAAAPGKGAPPAPDDAPPADDKADRSNTVIPLRGQA
jgi:lambda family phage portal protein